MTKQIKLDPEVIFLGDIHGRVYPVVQAIDNAVRHEVKDIIQIGDFWAYDQYRLKEMEEYLSLYKKHLYFIPGNHEDHDYLDELVGDDYGQPVEMTEHITYMPPNSTMKIGYRDVLCLGKAFSIDVDSRIKGRDWFEQEVLSVKDIGIARNMGKFDIVLTHDCPNNVNMPDGCFIPTQLAEQWFGADNLAKANFHRELLEESLENTHYKYLIHGHYHYKYETDIDNEDNSHVIGLACEDNEGAQYLFDANVGVGKFLGLPFIYY